MSGQERYEVTLCAECGQRVEMGGHSDDWLPLSMECPRRCGVFVNFPQDPYYTPRVPGIETVEVVPAVLLDQAREELEQELAIRDGAFEGLAAREKELKAQLSTALEALEKVGPVPAREAQKIRAAVRALRGEQK